MKKRIRNLILSIASLVFTAYGLYLLFTGDLTNGLLSLILGELIDIPKARLSQYEVPIKGKYKVKIELV